MGARQSKRSVDISSTPKKGDLENGAVAGTEEKLEKIGEGELTVTKINANGSTTTTSTLTVEQQEAATSTVTVANNTQLETSQESFKVEGEESGKSEMNSSVPASTEDKKEEPSSPASPTDLTTNEEGGSDKKKKPKKKWSFRSWSFSKKDRVKPAPKDDKQETVPEDNEGSGQQVNPEITSVSCVHNEEPPPLPTSPPPTPAEEAPVEKEETPTISEGDIDASGGGEGLAEPIEDVELVESEPVVVAVESPLTNGVTALNGDSEMNGKLTEDEDLMSPVCERNISVDTVTAKIGSLKLQIAPDNTEPLTQNGVEETSLVEMNGIADKTDTSLEKAVVGN